jgi:hypothetical protein
MQGLPADVRHIIYGRCNIPDLLHWALVSKAWRAELRANGPWAAHVARVLYEFPEMHVFFDAYAKLRHRDDTRNRIAERPSKARKTSLVTPRGYWWVFAHVLLRPERHLQRYCAYKPIYERDEKAVPFCIMVVRCLLPKQRKLINTIDARMGGKIGMEKAHIRAQLNVGNDLQHPMSLFVFFDNGVIDARQSSLLVVADTHKHLFPSSGSALPRACSTLRNFIATGILAPSTSAFRLISGPMYDQVKAL